LNKNKQFPLIIVNEKEVKDMKSYVTMALCPICGKSNGELLLDRRLRDTFEHYTVNPSGVCDECREKYLKEGVMFINPETGSLYVIKEEAARRVLSDSNVSFPEKERIVFCDEGIIGAFHRVETSVNTS